MLTGLFDLINESNINDIPLLAILKIKILLINNKNRTYIIWIDIYRFNL
jgi:hypothetical protein